MDGVKLKINVTVEGVCNCVCVCVCVCICVCVCVCVCDVCAQMVLYELESVQECHGMSRWMGANKHAGLNIWDVLFYFLLFNVSHRNKGQRDRFHTWQKVLFKLIKL